MDLGFLRPLYDSPPDGRGACFASVYVDITRSTENGWAAQDRADAAIARSIAGTGASLHFLPADTDPPRGGVGALLRAPLAAL